ncbi:MAG TPA: phospho-sugar mutase, partial [Pirellulales bacterium]|nr:phospho-sugar mutase [Pirellulales bacterium]
MSENATTNHRGAQALALLEAATSHEQIASSAGQNIRQWLTVPRYRDCVGIVTDHLKQAKWAELNEAFWTVAPFGTAGRRARMYPIGSNAMNSWTVGETAQGLAKYCSFKGGDPTERRVAIAYDTRHRSREFAELCAEVMAAAGYRVFCWESYRSTPELSFAVRQLDCCCGIMISASHNPPSDNALKIFGPDGGQLRPDDVEGVLLAMSEITEIRRRRFAEARAAGQIVYCQEEMDHRYQAAVLAQAWPGPRALKLLYSPLHGVGLTSVWPVLKADGFRSIEIYAPQAEPDGSFPNVPQGVANPEEPA